MKKSSTFLSKLLSQSTFEKYFEKPDGTGLGTTPHLPVPVGGMSAENDSRDVEFEEEDTNDVDRLARPEVDVTLALVLAEDREAVDCTRACSAANLLVVEDLKLGLPDTVELLRFPVLNFDDPELVAGLDRLLELGLLDLDEMSELREPELEDCRALEALDRDEARELRLLCLDELRELKTLDRDELRELAAAA